MKTFINFIFFAGIIILNFLPTLYFVFSLPEKYQSPWYEYLIVTFPAITTIIMLNFVMTWLKQYEFKRKEKE